ncbi:hypothetical protein G3I01_11100 [Gramella sp. MT6]|uniref:glycosyltransferase family 29 protein n=1 Tax=Gramella sp. MT6 TaxID=2705471 RepID=UPI001C5D9ECB|nr:glycosyltransferase family 29 protein [Gramella sp. MT6]QYA26039.1 hypothetical protein G3I01_11100 [Gramella sp. MT6]
MEKINESIKGLVYTLRNSKKFEPNKIFKNRRVAIVGPADSAFDNAYGSYIDDFDYVIRINKTPSSWNPENEKYIGRKTDIWFHSFFENRDSGGGPLDPYIIKNMNIEYLVNPRSSFKAYRRTFNFYRKYQENISVYHLESKVYKDLLYKFPKKLRPTVGFVALYSALKSECEELYITGYTFFKTPYAKGYRDHLLDLDKNKMHFKSQGIHDADLEYQIFKSTIQNHNCKILNIDNKLNEILNS